MRIEYGDKIIKTARIKIADAPGYLGRVATAVGDLGGMFGEIKTVHIGKGYKVRDLDLYTDNEASFNAIIDAVKAIEGVEVVEILDIVQEAHRGGKVEIRPTVDVDSIDDLKIVYTPGVASICRLIQKDPSKADEFTGIRNNVAIVTNGTAILGLGDIGPVAGMPVMEGKALLFKLLADINGYPVLIDSKNSEEIINTVKNIAPTFGAIKLEDIKAPECFEIEDRLQELLDIPVLHDDQHGTATVVLAALMNIARYAFVNIRDASVGIIGLGAAGTGIYKLLTAYGVKTVYGVDIDPDSASRFGERGGIVTDLAGLMEKARIVIATTGCPGLIKKEMVRPGQVILALSNPNPEITPEDALAAGAAFAADGRAVNNALAFPGLFKGALLAKANRITDAMKIAAADAIAKFALDGDLVPNILDKRVHEMVAEQVKQAAYRK